MIWILVLLISLSSFASGSEVLFEMADRSGDDFGIGNLTYPTHESFAPFKDLFDLTNFTAMIEGEYLLLDLGFSLITNPWKAPEGFFHQHALVFIRTGDGSYSKHYEPLGFDLNEPYTYVVRIAPWSLSTIRDAEGNVLDELIVETINQQTIRAYIPLELVKLPEKSWKYAVLVGGYDAFGKDLFREVVVNNTQWEFGGGGAWPFVDILAPTFGRDRQQDQLEEGVFYFQNHRGDRKPFAPWWFWVILGLILLGGGYVFLRQRGFRLNYSLKFPRREHTKKGSITRWG